MKKSKIFNVLILTFSLMFGKTETSAAAVDGYVDLGLSVMWAEKNLGANSPGEVGNLYPWGYITPTVLSSWKQYKFISGYTYALPLTDICGNRTYDAVAAATNGAAQLPSKAQAEELLANCDYEADTLDGVNGMYFISRINGNRIFLPLAVSQSPFYWLGTANDAKTAGQILDLDFNYKGIPGVSTQSQCYFQRPLRGVRNYDNVKLESLEIVEGDTTVYINNNFYLTVKASPVSYIIKGVEWSSSNGNVATVVNEKGLVYCRKAGTCVLTATVDGVSASIKLTVKGVNVPTSIYGVDMGNNLYWYPCDVGAPVPYERGPLYYFGSTTPGVKPTSYPDNLIGTELDPSPIVLHPDWHIPTAAEWEWLIANTDMEWVTWNERVGALLTSKITGEQLYFTWNYLSEVYYYAAETVSNDHKSVRAYHAKEGLQTLTSIKADTPLSIRAVRTYNPEAGLNEISCDAELSDVYTVSGFQVLKDASPAEIKALPSGLYIVRNAGKTTKLIK